MFMSHDRVSVAASPIRPGGFARSPEDYARSRALQPQVESQIADSLMVLLEGADHVLDLGAGTGRISHLLLGRGLAVTALDLSRSMLQYLADHRPSGTSALELTQADLVRLPFRPDSFPAALTVHVLHLVPDWRMALAEVLRVLRPGGKLLVGLTEHDQSDPTTRIADQWRRILANHGVGPQTPVRYDEEIGGWLTERGAARQDVVAASWQRLRRPREYLDEIGQGLYPFFWTIPEEIFPALLEELETWVSHSVGEIDAPIASEVSFVWRVYTLPLDPARAGAGGGQHA
jgi:SAM-dependent methyltransferase